VIEIRTKIAGLNPRDGTARIRLAETLQREGRMDSAIDQYEEFARQLEERGGDKAKLADLYEKILAYRPDNPGLVKKVIGLYEELGDSKKALKWLEQAKGEVERDVRLLTLAAEIYASQNQFETARTKYMLLADRYQEAGDIDAALEACFEILVMLPDEEERLERRVEELKPGAMAELSSRAQARRQELEVEEHRRNEAEEQKREARERGEEAPAPHRAVPAKKSEAAAKEATTEPHAAPKPAPLAPPPAALDAETQKRERGRADAAYALAGAYQKMGLAAEAHAEFEKALISYRKCVDGGGEDPALLERAVAIERSFGRESPALRPSIPIPEAALQQEPASVPAKEEAPDRPAPKDAPPKKRRVSFV
jgi:tetratricopeptide (TPR) repeat protein